MSPQGLSFKKFDLHIHTPASQCFADRFEDEKSAAQAIVKEATKKELAAIAITDHNTGRFIDLVRREAKGTNLTVFPGVEITVGDAHNHVLAILDVDKTSTDIDELLMVLGIPSKVRGKKEAFSDKTVVQAIDIICKRPFHGIVVPAHIDTTNGIFEQMTGQPRIEVIQKPEIIAVEAVDYAKVSKLLSGQDPNYRRKLTVYQSSDNPSLGDDGKLITSGAHSGMHSINGIGYRYTYFNVDEKINLESLRQCFIDPEVRIRQSWEYEKGVYPHVKKVNINSGFLDDVKAEFHPGLNSILGAKGVGKSLLIEFIRFALDQEPSQEEAKIDHVNKLEAQLRQYGEVEVIACDETGKEFQIKRTYDPAENNPLHCIDISKNEVIDVNISKLFPVIALSQNEIIKIAEDKADEQLRFIDRFFDFHLYKDQIDYLEDELQELDREFSTTIRSFHEGAKLTKQLQTAKVELERLTEQLKNPIFTEIGKYESKDKVFSTQERYLATLKDYILKLINIIKQEKTPVLGADLSNDPSLKRNMDILTTTKSKLLDDLTSHIEMVDTSTQRVIAEHQKSLPAFNQKKNELKEIVLKLGGDVQSLEQKRKNKIKEIENIETKLSSTEAKAQRTKEIFEKREEMLRELKGVYSSYFRERKGKCEFFEKASDGNLKIEIQESSNIDEFKNRLLSLKRGSYLRDVEIEQICEKVSPQDFILELLRYDILLVDKPSQAGSRIKQLSRMAELPPEKIKGLVDYLLVLIEDGQLEYEDLLRLQYKAYPVDRPVIMYNIGDNTNPKYESLDKVSTGQKCTAMLILALSDSKMPIIIDQPEDSIDIKTIWHDMCLKIRSGKERRQFIFTTHNSSVAVASDTDKFMIMTGTASSGEIVLSGTVDNENIRKEIIDYLEGGLTTYRLKYLKYNMPKAMDGSK